MDSLGTVPPKSDDQTMFWLVRKMYALLLATEFVARSRKSILVHCSKETLRFS